MKVLLALDGSPLARVGGMADRGLVVTEGSQGRQHTLKGDLGGTVLTVCLQTAHS